MKTRARKFIDDNLNGLLQFALPFPVSMLEEKLEQFHKECQPTDDEALSQICRSITFSESAYEKEIKNRVMAGVKLCRDFVREEPKEKCEEKTPTNFDLLKFKSLVYDMAKYFEGCDITKEEKPKTVRGNFVWEDDWSGHKVVKFKPDENGQVTVIDNT